MKWRKRSEKVIFQAAPDGMLSLKSEDGLPRPVGKDVGQVEASSEALDAYVEFLKGTISTDLTGLKVVVDCGHGAAYQVSPPGTAGTGR